MGRKRLFTVVKSGRALHPLSELMTVEAFGPLDHFSAASVGSRFPDSPCKTFSVNIGECMDSAAVVPTRRSPDRLGTVGGRRFPRGRASPIIPAVLRVGCAGPATREAIER